MNTALRQRLLASFMAALLAVSMMPAWAFANGDSQTQSTVGDSEQNADQNVGEISSGVVGDASGSALGAGGFGDAPAGDSPSSTLEDLIEGGVSKSDAAVVSSISAPGSLQSVLLSALEGGGSEEGVLPENEEQINVTVSISGPNANGERYYWLANTTFGVQKSDRASSVLEKALEKANLRESATIYGSEESWYLSSIKAPYNASLDLGWNESTGEYWQLFVNGEASDCGAGQVVLAEGDSISLSYSTYGSAAPGWVSSSISFIGQDINGNAVRWSDARALSMPEGSTVADLTDLFFDKGFLKGSSDSSNGWFLDKVRSPFDESYVLGMSQDVSGNWNYWALYVDGQFSEAGAGDVPLSSGLNVVWAYTTYGSPLPDPDEFVIDSDAERPGYSASWAGFGNAGNSALTDVSTPSGPSEKKWSLDLRTESDPWVAIGDPVIAGASVFVTTNTELVKIDFAGNIVGRVKKGGTTSYFSRPVYADGLIICASDNGSLAAFTADTLTCVWRSPVLAKPCVGGKELSYQANSTMSVLNGRVYAEFTAGAGAVGTAAAGAMVCVDLESGSLVWHKETIKGENDFGAGYYWAGACVSDGDLVIADESGSVKLIDSVTGDVKSSAALVTAAGSSVVCRSTVVSAGLENGKQVFLVVGREPATLFKVVREGDVLKVVSSVGFAISSTSTPAVANGKAYVGGRTSDAGCLAVVDVGSMEIEDLASVDAEVKASPLVSVGDGVVLAYFTANGNPGAVYCYNSGSRRIVTVYAPSGEEANWCTASVVADSEGNLYYSNDSGRLFCIKALASSSSGESGGLVVGNDDSSSSDALSSRGGAVAPANLPVSLEESVACAIEEAEANGVEAAALRSAAGVSVEDGAGVPAWAYVVLGAGGVAAFAAAACFVAARRRVI